MQDEQPGDGRLLALRRYLAQHPARVVALCLCAVGEACAQTGSWLLVRVAINNGIVAHNEHVLDLTLAAFVLDWGDGRADFDPAAAADRVAQALHTALAAEGLHAEPLISANEADHG